MAAFLRLLTPQPGAVPPNASIALEGHTFGPLVATAVADGAPIPVTVGAESPLSFSPFGNSLTYFLVRPQSGEWPARGTVVLTLTHSGTTETVQVPIDGKRDASAPAFESLSSPAVRTASDPRGGTQVVAMDHGGFRDLASPLVRVELAFAGGGGASGLVPANTAASIWLRLSDPLPEITAITLTDLSGNATRIESPCGVVVASPDPLAGLADAAFTCLFGELTAVDRYGTFLGKTDGSALEGYSRGQFLSKQPAEGDLDISVTATRLSDEHEMPIEIGFRGGFFGVTGNSNWYLYESDANWTGWRPTPHPTDEGPRRLRVVQRGQKVTGYVDDALAGIFELQKPAPNDRVGVFFKGHPGAVATLRFGDFKVQPAPVDPIERPGSVTLIMRWVTAPDDIDQLDSLDDRRNRDCIGFNTFPIRSGRLPFVFLRRALGGMDLGVFGFEPEQDDAGELLTTEMIDGATLADVLPRIEQLVEDVDATVAALVANAGGTSDPARVAAALRTGVWPETGDAAEEVAAFTFHLRACARKAVTAKFGLLIESRGALAI